MTRPIRTVLQREPHLSLRDRSALVRERAEHNRVVTTRIAGISVVASLLLFAQHLLAPSTLSPLGTPVWRAYAAIYTAGVVGGVVMIVYFAITRRWRPGRVRFPALICAGIFALMLTGLSVVDSGVDTDIAGLILGIIVVASTYRARYGFYVGVVAGATIAYLAGLYSVWGNIRTTAAITAPVVAVFALYVAAAMEGNRVSAFLAHRELDRQNRTLAHLSSTDPLTGVLNRRTMEYHLDVQIDAFRRYGAAFSIVMLDVDRFKLVNDTHGHAAGDQVLAGMGRLLRESLRTSDEVARYGGEEFVLILPHTGLDRAAEVAERLRQSIEAVRFSEIALAVTSSFGVAEVTAADPDMRSVLRRADAALYEAKETGRNRVVVSGHGTGDGQNGPA